MYGIGTRKKRIQKILGRTWVLQVMPCATKSLPYMIFFHIYTNVLSSTQTKLGARESNTSILKVRARKRYDALSCGILLSCCRCQIDRGQRQSVSKAGSGPHQHMYTLVHLSRAGEKKVMCLHGINSFLVCTGDPPYHCQEKNILATSVWALMNIDH